MITKLPAKFHRNRSRTFLIILITYRKTERQTERQTNRLTRVKQYLSPKHSLGRGNKHSKTCILLYLMWLLKTKKIKSCQYVKILIANKISAVSWKKNKCNRAHYFLLPLCPKQKCILKFCCLYYPSLHKYFIYTLHFVTLFVSKYHKIEPGFVKTMVWILIYYKPHFVAQTHLIDSIPKFFSK